MPLILLYVDDIILILIISSNDLWKSIMALLVYEFTMKDLSPLSYFLDISMTIHVGGLFPSQSIYASDIIARAGIASWKSYANLVGIKKKLNTTASTSYDDPTLYWSPVKALQYLTFTQFDISYVV